MGFFKIKKIKRGVKHLLNYKAARKKLGLTGKSRHIRQITKRLRNFRNELTSPVISDQPTSASTVYQYNGKTLSQLMGGV